MNPDFRIIKNEEVLFSDVLGDSFFKQEEREQLISELKPIAERQRCGNIFVYGPSGIGKTSLIKSVLNSIKNQNRSVICLYINCWHYSTSMAIYVKIADALGEPVSRRGRATDEIFDRILERMKNENIGIVLALDDIKGLIDNDTKILHNLARATESNARFGIIGISDDRNILNKLESKVIDSLGFSHFEIKGYTKFELMEILKARAELGLFAGSYTNEILEKIADLGVENRGNGRLVVEALRISAKMAQRKSNSIISVEDVEAASICLGTRNSLISKEEQIIIDILKPSKLTTSEVYLLFCKKLIRSKRQIRNYIRNLELKSIIKSSVIDTDYTLGSKVIMLNEGWYG